jgi:hydrogenase expression/formation protein HypE
MKEMITLAHGSGGAEYRALVQEVFLPAFSNDLLSPLQDSAVCRAGELIAMTTDSFVVKPLFFPGGDIGRLSICGTVNDLLVSGAEPRYISAGMIIEAGFKTSMLVQIVESMAAAAREAGVLVVTGDTKVVEGGSADGIFINTAGVGVFSVSRPPLPQKIEAGDCIIVSGYVASHGMAILSAREEIAFSPPIESDAAPLNLLVDAVLASGGTVRAMRDPTRGGVAAALCEWAGADMDILIDEPRVPVRPDVAAACRILGMDPLYIANEGVVLVSVPACDAGSVLPAMRKTVAGRQAAVIGEVRPGSGKIYARTGFGTSRRILEPRGELLPRIC